MYTAAELFNLATMADAKEVFLSNVTMSIPDDLPGCANLDAEKDRLSKIWEVAHMSINEMVAAVGLSKTNFAKETGIPFRSIQNWSTYPPASRRRSAAAGGWSAPAGRPVSNRTI